MWKEMAQWQTFTINSAMHGKDRCSQQKLGSTHVVLGFDLSCGLFTPRCLHPPPLADNHKAGLSFFTLLSFFSHY